MSTHPHDNDSGAVQRIFKTAQPTRDIHSLRPHPDNPRGEISRTDPKIIELAGSIREHGILEPLVITPEGFIIAGHRRRIAAFVAELSVVPIVVREVAPGTAVELMLSENMQRESLNPLEEARAMRSLLEVRRTTVSELARTLSLPVSEVSNRLAIMKCEEEVRELFARRELPLAAAAWLARVTDAVKQVDYAGLLARRQLSFSKLKTLATAPMLPAPSAAQVSEECAADVPDIAKTARRGQKGGPKGTGTTLHHVADSAKAPTRAEAIGMLQSAINPKPHEQRKTSLSLFAFSAIVKDLCCSCGMEGQEAVCRTCPFPRLIQAVVGRAE